MKRLIMVSAFLLSACSNSTMPVWRASPAAPVASVAAAANDEAATPAAPAATGASVIETVPFRLGSSSVTVEDMAKQQACTGGRGAALVTPPGIVEVYRMACDDGRVFRATCDMHQCKPM